MNIIRTLRPIIAGALLCGSVAVTGIGLGTGTAHATAGPFNWCPGQSMDWPSGPDMSFGVKPKLTDRHVWDMNVCHTWYRVETGWGNVPWIQPNGQQTLSHSDVWDGDNPPGDNPGNVHCGLMFCPNPGGTPPGFHP
jgi:hypothetical protein